MTAIDKFHESTDLFRQAELLSKSGIVPAVFRGKPADVLAATLWGAELGLGPMASLMLIEPIQGTPSMKAEGRLALIRRAGHSVRTKELNDDHCVMWGKRRDTGDEETVTFSMKDAAAANLTGKSVWKQYRQDMLFNRAVSRISRRLFSDVFMGLSYAPEEVASFAAPAMLDDQAAALAGEAEIVPQPQEDRLALQEASGKFGSDGPITVDTTTGEVIDTASVGKPDGVVAAGQRATEQRHRYDPPTKPTSADNTRKIMADLSADDYVDKADAKELLKRIGTLSGDALAAFNAGINAAGLTVPTTMKVGKDDYAKFVALLDGEVKVA